MRTNEVEQNKSHHPPGHIPKRSKYFSPGDPEVYLHNLLYL